MSILLRFIIIHIKFPVFKIVFSILLRDCAQHPAGIAHCDHIIRNILCHNAPGADYHIVPNGYARIDHCIASQPYIVADGHADAVFIA